MIAQFNQKADFNQLLWPPFEIWLCDLRVYDMIQDECNEQGRVNMIRRAVNEVCHV